MKILAINGSHRKGNIDFMLGLILDSAKGGGAETDIVCLRDKRIGFCFDDDYYEGTKKSVRDDMKEVFDKLEDNDIILLASPSYFSNVSARMKNFMDRCNPYWFNKKLKGKKVFLLGVGGSGDKSIKEMLDRMKAFVRILGMEEVGSYYTKADKVGELMENQKVIKEIEEIGKKLSKK